MSLRALQAYANVEEDLGQLAAWKRVEPKERRVLYNKIMSGAQERLFKDLLSRCHKLHQGTTYTDACNLVAEVLGEPLQLDALSEHARERVFVGFIRHLKQENKQLVLQLLRDKKDSIKPLSRFEEVDMMLSMSRHASWCCVPAVRRARFGSLRCPHQRLGRTCVHHTLRCHRTIRRGKQSGVVPRDRTSGGACSTSSCVRSAKMHS